MTQNETPANLEIERKFLVELKNDPKTNGHFLYIKQAYLVEGETEIRVRSISKAFIRGGGSIVKYATDYFMTVKKSLTKLSRKEIEFNIDKDSFIELWNLSHCQIKKKRTQVPMLDWEYTAVWEIDEYDNGLVTMEIELPSEDVLLPPFPDCVTVIKEITGNKEYRNSTLAKSIPYTEHDISTDDLIRTHQILR